MYPVYYAYMWDIIELASKLPTLKFPVAPKLTGTYTPEAIKILTAFYSNDSQTQDLLTQETCLLLTGISMIGPTGILERLYKMLRYKVVYTRSMLVPPPKIFPV